MTMKMKKKTPLLILSSSAIAGIAFGYSSWVANGAVFNSGETNKVSEASAYIHNFTSGTIRYFTTIEGALSKSVSGEMVVAIPPSDAAYYPTDSDDRRAASERMTVNWSSLTTLKTSYTIKRDCVVKSGVTFVLPNASIVSTVTSASTLSTYIEGMKKGTKQNATDGIFYKKDANGNYLSGNTVVSSASLASQVYNFHKNFATAHENVFLRTTVSLADGISLQNQGTIVVAGLLSQGDSAAGVIGHTSHSYSRILIGKNAKIIQDGSASKTYCYGYISEAAKDNSSLFILRNGALYLPFIVDDYRGFQHSWSMTNGAITTERCSPFNQIEFRNIDVKAIYYYNSKVYGLVNNMVIYDTMGVNESFTKEISLIGNASDFAYQLTDSTYSSLSYKYNVSDQVSTIVINGGLNLNPITNLEFKKSSVDVNLATTESFFPFSYRWNITLSKGSAQTAATYNATAQRFKILPGSSLYIDNGCTLNANAIVVYSAFYDGYIGNGQNSRCGYGVTYPLKDGGVLEVADTGKLVATSLAGKVYGSTSNITYTTGQITSKEAWNVKSSGSINPPWTIDDYLEIRETIDISPLADFSKSKLYVGLNTFTKYSSLNPAVNVISNPNDSATTTTTHVDNYQKVILYDNISDYRIDFVRNVYRSYYSLAYYAKNQVVSYSGTNNKFGAINSTLNISNNNSGVNEFNVQGVTVACSTPLVNGNIPLYVGSSVTMTATVVDIDKAYNKDITWTSSDTSIATVDSKGSVTGVALGAVTITATCDGVSGSMAMNVIAEQAVTEISSITIVDNNGNSSDVTAGTSDFGNSGASVAYNGKYGNSQTITFTVNINPNGAPYQSITWEFTPSGADRQTFNGNSVSALTEVSGVTTVTVGTLSGTGSSDDKATLTCTVVDLKNNTFKKTFVINHKADVQCIVEGTLLTMADGSYKKVEDIKAGDLVKVFDHDTGKVGVSPICVNVHVNKPAAQKNVLNLHFSSGKTVRICYEHGFFDVAANKYVYIDESNYQSMIGREFISIDSSDSISKVKLVSGNITNEFIRYFSPITFSTLDIISDDILSISGDMRGVFNIFDLDENMKVDEAKKQADIAKYGLFTYEEWAPYLTELQFQAFNVQYFKVSIGKKLCVREDILRYIRQYLHEDDN